LANPGSATARWGSLQCSTDPLAVFKGLFLRGGGRGEAKW